MLGLIKYSFLENKPLIETDPMSKRQNPALGIAMINCCKMDYFPNKNLHFAVNKQIYAAIVSKIWNFLFLKMKSNIKNSTFFVSITAVSLMIGGCGSTNATRSSVEPLNGSAVERVSTEFTPALFCLAEYVERRNFLPPRIAVGHITDATGANDYFDGKRVTQGATLMAKRAVAEAGMRLVERFDLGVLKVDLDYSQNNLINDGSNRNRAIRDGQISGADLYIVGGITEFNPNIRSRAGDFFGSVGSFPGASLGIGVKDFVFDVAIDMRVVDAQSSDIVYVSSFRKQLRGHEIEAGILASFKNITADIGAGQRRLEPTQTGIRSMIERAIFEFGAEIYNMDKTNCPLPDGGYEEEQKSRNLLVRRGNGSLAQEIHLRNRRQAQRPDIRSQPATITKKTNEAVPAVITDPDSGATDVELADSKQTQRSIVLAVAETKDGALTIWESLKIEHKDILNDAVPEARQFEAGEQSAYALVVTLPEGISTAHICDTLTERGAECAVVP